MRVILTTMIFLFIFSCSNQQFFKTDQSLNSATSVNSSDKIGTSFTEAVVLADASSPSEGFAAEYKYISKLHGQRGQDWFLIGQTIIKENDKVVDVVEIKLNNSFDRRIFFFDASTFVSAQ
jgi:hypothetical protein